MKPATMDPDYPTFSTAKKTKRNLHKQMQGCAYTTTSTHTQGLWLNCSRGQIYTLECLNSSALDTVRPAGQLSYVNTENFLPCSHSGLCWDSPLFKQPRIPQHTHYQTSARCATRPGTEHESQMRTIISAKQKHASDSPCSHHVHDQTKIKKLLYTF